MTDHSTFNNIIDINQKGLYAQLETNIKDFLDWSFIDIQAYNTVYINSAINSKHYTLMPVTGLHPSLNNKIWEAPFKEWIPFSFPNEICSSGSFTVPFLTDWKVPLPACVPSGKVDICNIIRQKKGKLDLSIWASGTDGLNPDNSGLSCPCVPGPEEGEILFHTDGISDSQFSTDRYANILFTCNFNGTINIDGNIFISNIQYFPDRSSYFELYVDNNLISSSSNSPISIATNTINNPYNLINGSGGPSALTNIPVAVGSKIELRLLSSTNLGWFVGTRFNITHNESSTLYSLKNDWNNTNPNGPWAYRSGDEVIRTGQQNWAPWEGWHNQFAFAPGSSISGIHVPAILKLHKCPLTTTPTTPSGSDLIFQGSIGNNANFNVGSYYHNSNINHYGQLRLFTNTCHNYSEDINLSGYTIEAIYKNSLSSVSGSIQPPCYGGHICNRAKFNILLNNIQVLEADLNNSGTGSPPPLMSDGIGSDALDRYSSTTISPSLNQEIKNASLDNKLNISILPHPDNPNAHNGITWIRIKNTSGDAIYSSCLAAGKSSLVVCKQVPSGSFVGGYKLCNTDIPSPIHISGIYLNDTFLPAPTGSGNYGYHINHPLGRIVFDNPVNPTSSVKLEYSHKQIQIYKSEEISWWKEIQKTNYGLFNDHQATVQLLAEHRVQTPFIIVETIARNQQIPYELGNISNILDQDILLHIFTHHAAIRSNLIDILLSQKDKNLILYDLNKVIADGMYGLNYRGEKNITGLNYGQLVTNSLYQYKQCYIKNSVLSELNNFSSSLYNGIVRWTLEIFP